jgi:signal transduction histidine kinase
MGQKRILIIDDNPEDRALYRRFLSKSGNNFDFIECATGADGLRACLESSPDCILLDYRLPDMDGVELLAQLNNACADLCAVVVLTRNGSETIAVQSLQKGAQDYLSKDALSPETLARSIDNAIEKVILRRELLARTEMLAKANAELESQRATLEDEVQQRTAELRKAHDTEQELRKRAEGANRMKDEFLALLSHELRTPLNAILGWLAAIQSERLNDEQRKKALDSITRNGFALAQLIEDLLDVSGMMTGKFRIGRQPTDLNSIAQSALESIQPLAEEKSLKLLTEIGRDPVTVSADPDRIRQAIINVLSNAVKFTEKDGSITLRLETDDNHAKLEVSDTGIGIRPEFMPFVFERFSQADLSIKRRHGGLGIGLAIVRHIVELHGGTVKAHSRGIGQGTTITLRVPLTA